MSDRRIRSFEFCESRNAERLATSDETNELPTLLSCGPFSGMNELESRDIGSDVEREREREREFFK